MTPKANLPERSVLSGRRRVRIVALAWLAAAPLAAQSRPGGPSAVEALRHALELGQTEKTALGDVTDGSTQWREPAFYLLLRRISELPSLASEDMHSLDAPAYRSLLREPQRYRARPMRRRVRIYRVLKMMPGRRRVDLGYSSAWPKDRPVWQIYCAGADAPDPADEPMVVFSTVEPVGLGQPGKVTTQGEQMFPRGPELGIACVFYKVLRDAERNSGHRRDYPLLLAWQMFPCGNSLHDAEAPRIWIIAASIGALGVGYFFLRRHVRRFRRPAPAGARASRPADAGPEDDVGRADAPVDPQLKEAAEQYRQERRDGDRTNR